MGYLISETTREEREKLMRDATCIALLDLDVDENEGKELFDKYINGEMELEDIKRIILAEFSK